MFKLFEPLPFQEKAPRWSGRASLYAWIFGLSPFADLFVCSNDQKRYAVISTEHPELIELHSENMNDFLSRFIGDPQVRRDFFREKDYEALSLRLGPLAQEECFFAVPYTVVGETGALDTYQKGDVWVHLDLYGQTLGL